MSTAEMQLLSRIIRTGDLPLVLAWGISSDDFRTSEGLAMFNHLVGYYSAANTMHSIPGIGTIKNNYPLFEMVDDPHMTTEALCSEVRRVRLILDTKETAKQLVEAAEIDPLEAATQAQARINYILSLGMAKTTDVTFSVAMSSIVSKYKMKEQGHSFAKCPWPWAPLNEATGGIQEDDYVVFYGRPKSMKSWVLAALIGFVFNMDKRAIIYTKEMTPENIFARTAACIAGIPYQELRMGKLEKHHRSDLIALDEMVQATGMNDKLLCLSGKDAAPGTDTIQWLEAKIEKYKPDLCFIDGLYLLSSANGSKSMKDNERVMAISRAARTMQMNTKVPLIVTMQANRAAAKHQNAELDEIAFSDAIGQDATIAVRVINEKVSPTIALVLAGSREFQLHGFRIGGVPATDFSYKEKLSEKEINAAQKQDAKDDPDKTKKLPKLAHTKAKINGAQPSTPAAQAAAADAMIDQELKRI